ncbi:hypothetical protein MA785_000829 [Vibrio parahaemolyticus]|nr:hypothetical protein [Vibrio parahaemolyticus]EJR2787938.1 hypothetical protein [Vibrio parahaemolyticus]
MTIRIDKGSIERAHKQFELIAKEEKMIPVIELFIENTKPETDEMSPEKDDDYIDNKFDRIVYNITHRNDFIANLWNSYATKKGDIEKSKNTMEEFYKYCREQHSEEAISKRQNESDFVKIKQAILEKIERAAGNNKQNWLALSKITMSAIKEKTESKTVKPKSTVSSKEDSPVSEKLASNQTTNLHNQERQNS